MDRHDDNTIKPLRRKSPVNRSLEIPKMKKEKKRKQFLCQFERFMYKVCIFAIVVLILGIVCSETSLAQLNVEVQKKEKEVEEQKKKIESLEMKIDEMTSLENIKEVSLLYKGKRYTFTFIGEKYFTDEYVKDLLDTIVID